MSCLLRFILLTIVIFSAGCNKQHELIGKDYGDVCHPNIEYLNNLDVQGDWIKFDKYKPGNWPEWLNVPGNAYIQPSDSDEDSVYTYIIKSNDKKVITYYLDQLKQHNTEYQLLHIPSPGMGSTDINVRVNEDLIAVVRIRYGKLWDGWVYVQLGVINNSNTNIIVNNAE